MQAETALEKDNWMAQYCGIDPSWIDEFLIEFTSGRSENHEDKGSFLSTARQKKEEGTASYERHGEKNE